MNKKFFMAVLVGFLSICAFAVSAQDNNSLTAKHRVRILAFSNGKANLTDKLKSVQSALTEKDGRVMGYLVNAGKDDERFVSLAGAIPQEGLPKDAAEEEFLMLGHFKKDDTIQFGYQQGDQFSSINVLNNSDALYRADYKAEGFYQLDFSEMPFDGKIDVLVVGEPLPGSTVTLILSLAALALFMGYTRRRQQRAAVQES